MERVPDQHPTNRHRRQAGVMPDRGATADLNDTISFAVPARHGQPLPPRGLVMPELPQRGESFSLLAGAAMRAGRTEGSRFIQGRLQTQAGHDGDVLPSELRQPCEGRKGAIADDHERALRQPPPDLKNHLPCPAKHRFMLLPALLGLALARREAREKRQGPGAGRPRCRGQQHETPPAPAARLHERGRGTAHRIAVNAFGCDAFAAATLAGVVKAQPEADLAAQTAGPTDRVNGGRRPARSSERGSAPDGN